MSEDEGKEIKVILVGMSGTGKTNIINSLVGKPFDTNIISTTTSSFAHKIMTVNNKDYRLEIWDTAGQERYRSLTELFIKDSNIVIFVYDITSRVSFEEIDYWVTVVNNLLGKSPVFGLAGNKKDLFQEEKVDEEEGEKKAESIGAIFKLTSAKTGVGINDFMQKLLEKYIEKKGPIADINNKEKEENKGQKLNNEIINKEIPKKKCCK